MFIFIQRDFDPKYTDWFTNSDLIEGFDYEFFKYDSTKRNELAERVNDLPKRAMVFGGVHAVQFINKHRAVERDRLHPCSLVPECVTNYDQFLLNIPAKLRLNKSSFTLPAHSAFERAPALYKALGTYFLRPASGYKPYEAEIIDTMKKAEAISCMLSTPHCHSEAKVIICPVIWTINNETRFYVVDNQLVGSGVYRIERALTDNMRGQIESFCTNEVIPYMDNNMPHVRTYVVDVAQCGEEHGIVEFNAICASGTYNADVIPEIISALQDM